MTRTLIAAAGLALIGLAAPAFASDENTERAQGIAACRAVIAEQTGVAATSANVDFRRSETRGRAFNLRFAVKEAGATIGEARCVYTRRDAKVSEVTLDAALEARVQAATATAER